MDFAVTATRTFHKADGTQTSVQVPAFTLTGLSRGDAEQRAHDIVGRSNHDPRGNGSLCDVSLSIEAI